MNRNDILIEAEELKSQVGDPNLRLFDATVLLTPQASETARDRYEQAHIPGAVFLDHASISDSNSDLMFTLPGEAELAQAIGDLGISNDNDIVIYSSDQIMWATRVWWVLRYAGHKRVRVLNGGLSTWDGDLESTENSYPAASFGSTLASEMFADKTEVGNAVGRTGICTINALPHSFYTGEADIAYAKEGHITGSISLPFDQTMDGFSLKSNSDLVEVFSDRSTEERLIFYCGGGIAATGNACAALLAGKTNVAVYDGSMSEWLSEGLPTTKGSDPGRP